MKHHPIITVLLMSLLGTASHAVDIHPASCAKDAFAYPSLNGTVNGAAFMHLHNPTDQSWNIHHVTSDRAARTELHDHQHDASGMMKMVQLKELIVPPHETVELAPAGKHVMLFELHTPLKVGESFTVRFGDAASPVCEATISVRERG